MERRMASTVDKNYNYLVGETDAQVWVDAWLEIIAENPSIATDPDAMLGWFANAIESGVMSVDDCDWAEDFLERLEEPDDPVIVPPRVSQCIVYGCNAEGTDDEFRRGILGGHGGRSHRETQFGWTCGAVGNTD
jgi:hypothetical protein